MATEIKFPGYEGVFKGYVDDGKSILTDYLSAYTAITNPKEVFGTSAKKDDVEKGTKKLVKVYTTALDEILAVFGITKTATKELYEWFTKGLILKEKYGSGESPQLNPAALQALGAFYTQIVKKLEDNVPLSALAARGKKALEGDINIFNKTLEGILNPREQPQN